MDQLWGSRPPPQPSTSAFLARHLTPTQTPKNQQKPIASESKNGADHNDCHEYIFHLTPKGITPIDLRAVGVEIQTQEQYRSLGPYHWPDKLCRGNTWFIPYETIQNRDKKRPHPATFPIALPEQCIRLHGCRPELVVMDPFLGIGSTWIAATRCAVGRFISFDFDPSNVSQARDFVVEPLNRLAG